MCDKKAEIFQGIDKLTRISRGFQGAVVLSTAAELELFTLLDKKALTPSEVAGSLGLDLRAASILLHALAGLELLEKKEGRFGNSPLAAELLVRGKPHYQGDIIRHSGHLIDRWMRLPEVLKNGRPPEQPSLAANPQTMRDFILGMHNIALLSAEKVAAALDLGCSRHLLDLGGGPGTYAITFCRLHPQLSAAVFDLPQVIEGITAGQVAAAGLQGRISLLKGDYLKDDIGSGYDLVLISNIIHSLGERGNRTLIGKAFRALIPGGRIVVKDFLLDENRVTPPFASMFAVNMLTGTAEGGCYTYEEVRGYLRDAGFECEESLDLSPQDRIVMGVKPA